MTRLGLRIRLFASIVAASAVLAVLERDRCTGASAGLFRLVDREQPLYESAVRRLHAGPRLRARQHNPNNNIPTVDLPVNIGVIKCGTELILYDTGWKQQDYLKMTGSDHWAPIGEQLKVLGFNAADVTKVVIGHAHWDHAGQLSDLPNAVLYVQKARARRDRVGIELSREAHQGDQL